MSAGQASVLRRITGYLGSFEKRRLWRKGFHESLDCDRWTAEQIRRWHDRQLTDLVRYAFERVPFYRRLYSRAGVDVNSFRGTADMHCLPTITKADLLESGEQMVRPDLPGIMMSRHTTGGSTGTIATVASPRGLSSYEDGCIYALWRRVGVTWGDRIVTLRGALLRGGKALCERTRREHRLTISTYHLNDQNVDEIIKLINDYRPDWLHVYPSAAALLAGILQRTGKRLARSPKGILCGSEKVYPWQIQAFNQAFGCRVYSHYGHGEMAVLGGWCEDAQTFHFLPNHGYLELLDDRQEPITEPGVTGEITGTGYLNRVMPLVRYRTADYGAWDPPGPCPACGREHQRLATIDGRIQEYLILADGTRFPATNINALHGTFFSYIYRFQFVQDLPGRATLRFVPAAPLTSGQFEEIREAFAYMDALGLKLDFEPVEDIPLTIRGKQRIVIGAEALAGEQR